MQILILGAGFGGLELASTLSEKFGNELNVVLVDRSEGFVFGFSKLDVMFGRNTPTEVFHPYSNINKPGVRFLHATVQSINPTTKHVETSAETFDPDIIVVALGADLDPAATPGLVEVGHEFYTVSGAFALRDVLQDFAGGDIVIGVTSTPFKCPPAPSETALLMHDFLVDRGIRDRSTISLVMPLPVPIPPSPDASDAILAAFAERNINWHPGQLISQLGPDRKVAVFTNGTEMNFDLFLGVPVHKVPPVIESSGLAVDGWIPVNPLTLETSYPGIYAVGDVTSVGTPKAGVFSERQASVVAEQITAAIRNESGAPTYDGRGTCYLEFGHDLVARVSVTFLSGQAPAGTLEGPSQGIAEDKIEFGTSRIRRWFDQ